jgi:hypothetical protein
MHRTRSRRRFSVALVSAATATATALTVGVEPPPDPAKRVVAESVDLAAAIQLLPTHDKVPDITGGLGTVVYNFNQTFLDQLSRAIVNGVSLTALAQAAGVDPKSLVDKLLTNIPANLVPDILAAISLDIPVLNTVLDQLTGGDQALLANVLKLLGVDDITDGTLTGLLALLGLDLSNPLNLSNLAVPGINLITPGAPFALLKMLGVDLGWVPGLPNSVANEINDSEYLKLGVNGVIQLLIGKLQDAVDNDTLDLLHLDALGDILGGLGIPLPLPGVDLSAVVGNIITSLGNLITPITSALPDVLHLRVTPTIGIGFGAFATAMAYKQVVDDLANQPGGTNYEALTSELNPLLGSLTVLPMILLNNPARPQGGLTASFAAAAKLLGLDAVNPHTELTGEGGLPLGTTGLHLGGANVLPVLIDATYEYQPLSDLASWPNPFSLANNLTAALAPTYMLRGLQLAGLTEQLTPQLANVVANVLGGKPLALNLYLTLDSATLPMLEPLYLASDLLNIVGLSPLAQIPMRLANALAPALTILTNIGYANVDQANGYTRDFSQAGIETPFLTFPNIDYGKALGDTFNALIGGFQKELGPNPTANTPNALASLLSLLAGGGLSGLTTGTTTPGAGAGTGATNPFDAITGLLTNVIGGLLGGLNLGAPTALAAPTPVTALSKTSAASVPSNNARLLSIASVDESTTGDPDEAKDGSVVKDSPTEQSAVVADKTPIVAETAPVGPEQTPPASETTPAAAEVQTPADEDTPAAGGDAKPAKSPKHAKPEGDSASVTGDQTAGPKHARPDTDAEPGADDSASDASTKKPPKHAKPTTNETRDTANDFSPKGDKSADKPGKTGDKVNESAGTSTTDTSEHTASDKAA